MPNTVQPPQSSSSRNSKDLKPNYDMIHPNKCITEKFYVDSDEDSDIETESECSSKSSGPVYDNLFRNLPVNNTLSNVKQFVLEGVVMDIPHHGFDGIPNTTEEKTKLKRSLLFVRL